MKTIAIVGATGYAGAELVALLLGHPEIAFDALTGSNRSEAPAADLADLHPRFRGTCPLPLSPLDPESIHARRPDAVLLATPHEASLDLASWFFDRGIPVVDLSAAFRLPDAALYPAHYGFEHDRKDLLATATYGLAELASTDLATAELIAVPGCYPTATILPVRPLVDAGLVDLAEPVIVDATSGVSGAGKGPRPHTSFCEVGLQPYAVLGHRHQPEMAAHTGARVMFTPHLGAFDRGILATIHLKLVGGVGEEDARRVLQATYGDHPCVQLLAANQWPSVQAVERTNRCDIGLQGVPEHGRLLISSAIDNLVKGAAGQAVQCLNLRLGLPMDLGLVESTPHPVGADA